LEKEAQMVELMHKGVQEGIPQDLVSLLMVVLRPLMVDNVLLVVLRAMEIVGELVQLQLFVVVIVLAAVVVVLVVLVKQLLDREVEMVEMDLQLLKSQDQFLVEQCLQIGSLP
tara:strand:+ start:34 stop:372 length:339 start_codon:yes stop_codon:yes gene_type:complete